MPAEKCVVQLRAFTPADISAFTEAVNASLDTLLPWMTWAHRDYREEEAESWIRFTQLQRKAGLAEEFAIVDQHGRLSGGAGIRFARNRAEFSAIGYWVRSDAQRRGIATQAVTQLIDLGFQRPDINVIEILAAEENRASRAVAERCGAQFIDCRYGLIVLEKGPVNTAIYHIHRDGSALSQA
ncbi:GNAT family N-acetyltransferase [Pantoea sp.]|uniref:GNAT family N-acetyltransferase n=1 Tax=Pantoea sp. TaxID=69393 RepID=UPI0028978A5B|nr:GNAT family N-acetyltransferase [Pantoea sp.]